MLTKYVSTDGTPKSILEKDFDIEFLIVSFKLNFYWLMFFFGMRLLLLFAIVIRDSFKQGVQKGNRCARPAGHLPPVSSYLTSRDIPDDRWDGEQKSSSSSSSILVLIEFKSKQTVCVPSNIDSKPSNYDKRKLS